MAGSDEGKEVQRRLMQAEEAIEAVAKSVAELKKRATDALAYADSRNDDQFRRVWKAFEAIHDSMSAIQGIALDVQDTVRRLSERVDKLANK